MKLYIDLIKVLAVALILNSHYDLLYPIKAFATGGAIGNSLFFAVSGYCLYNIKDNFVDWYKKRLFRIYPQVIITTFIAVIIGFYSIDSVKSIISKFIYPTEYWFISAIIVFYVAYYLILRNKYKNNLLKIIVLLIIPYILFYIYTLDTSQWIIEDNKYFKWIFYFQIMLVGAYFKQIEDKIKCKKVDKWILLAITIFYFGYKFLMNKSILFMQLQLVTHILTFPIVFYIFSIAKTFENRLQLHKNSIFAKFINLIGG